MPKEHSYITRLKKLLPIWNAYYDRKETTRTVVPPMHEAVAAIIKSAQTIEAGLDHLDEANFDSEELSRESGRITQIAVSLPDIFESDGSFWGYLLDLVNLETFRGGAEYLEVEQIDNLIWVLNEVKAIKVQIRDEKN